MGFYYYNYQTMLYLLPAILLTLYAQVKLNSTFRKYSQIPTSKGLTGAEAAAEVARLGGANIVVRQIGGNLTDNFDPRHNTISLSRGVYGNTSIAAVGVAAHEAGHSIQNAQGYLPNKIRTALVPVTQVGSRASIPLIIIGLILPVQYSFIVDIGIVLFGLVVLFQLVTLPVELNASRRALKVLDEGGILDGPELIGAQKVLWAAALTYLAASFTALMQLLRLLAISGSRRGNNR